jgi:hypothetical protein
VQTSAASTHRILALLQKHLPARVARASCPCFMGGTPMPRGVLQKPLLFMFLSLPLTRSTKLPTKLGLPPVQETDDLFPPRINQELRNSGRVQECAVSTKKFLIS